MTALAEQSTKDPFHVWFDRAVLAAIMLNPELLAWSLLDDTHEQLIETIHLGFTALFTVEVVVRLAEVDFRPGRFVRKPWNVFDLVLLIGSVLPIIGAGWAQLARFARIFHALRHLSTLRIAHITHTYSRSKK
jgi:voltage-gated sodium channel